MKALHTTTTVLQQMQELLSYMPADEWAEAISEILDDHTAYMLGDPEIIGHRMHQAKLFNLRMLRDLFKEIGRAESKVAS